MQRVDLIGFGRVFWRVKDGIVKNSIQDLEARGFLLRVGSMDPIALRRGRISLLRFAAAVDGCARRQNKSHDMFGCLSPAFCVVHATIVHDFLLQIVGYPRCSCVSSPSSTVLHRDRMNFGRIS